MKRFIIAAGIILFFSGSYAQNTPQDKLILDIPVDKTKTTTGISSYVKNNFSTDSERVRALFVWVTNNINYDIDRVRFKRVQERVTVEGVLKSRQAVCQGYAELLVQLCKEVGVKAELVAGYTKNQFGIINDMPHAWVAAELDNKWYLFDPTWSAGTVQDFKFIRMPGDRYYKKLPEEMIKDHMPFDPMFQFLNHPLLYDDFNKGNITLNTTKPYFNYADTLNAYHKLDSLNQFISVARRVNKNGEKNQMINEMVQVLMENQNLGLSKIGYDGAVDRFKKAMALFNRYVDQKNSRFSTMKNDKDIQQMMEEIVENYQAAKSLIEPVKAVNDEQKRILSNFNNSLNNFYRRVDEEKVFLKTYLKTDRAARR